MTDNPRIAVFPGSFDPITRGHEDVVRRALTVADRVVVAIAHQPSQTKQGMFSIEERLETIREVFAGVPQVEVDQFEGLLVDFARTRGASLVVRGLRGVKDFEYEFQMALMNRELGADVETVFLAPAAATSFLSSSLVREITRLGGDPSPFVSAPVLRRLRERFPGT